MTLKSARSTKAGLAANMSYAAEGHGSLLVTCAAAALIAPTQGLDLLVDIPNGTDKKRFR
jgi:hypothetical protein